MLLQNPQLAYALLQAQIVMKIVDPQVALVSSHLALTDSRLFIIHNTINQSVLYSTKNCKRIRHVADV